MSNRIAQNRARVAERNQTARLDQNRKTLGATDSTPTGYVGVRRHGNKRGADTKGQWQDSTGGTSGAWNRSADYWTDPKWSRTVSDGVR